REGHKRADEDAGSPHGKSVRAVAYVGLLFRSIVVAPAHAAGEVASGEEPRNLNPHQPERGGDGEGGGGNSASLKGRGQRQADRGAESQQDQRNRRRDHGAGYDRRPVDI